MVRLQETPIELVKLGVIGTAATSPGKAAMSTSGAAVAKLNIPNVTPKSLKLVGKLKHEFCPRNKYWKLWPRELSLKQFSPRQFSSKECPRCEVTLRLSQT